jgi:hypothetical protein
VSLALPAGRYGDGARALIAAARLDPFNAPGLYAEAVMAALLGGDADLAREALDGLDATGLHGVIVKLGRRLAVAGLAALDRRTDEARTGLREVADGYRRMDLARPLALTGLVMATLLDPRLPEVRAAIDESRAIFERLGARAWLARLDEVLAGKGSGTPDEDRPRRGAGERTGEVPRPSSPTEVPTADRLAGHP